MRNLRSRRAILAGLCLSVAVQAGAQKPALNPALPLVHVENGANSAAAQKAHYLVLVSLGGFRWDYAARDRATHLLALGKEGAWAPEGMLPSYPSLTFPNQYTMVTGLYPEHHGIVADRFYDPERKAEFEAHDAKAMTDGKWYGGVPLWSVAESQGMRTACLFWPGSEAEIGGHRPTWYARFDAKAEGNEAMQQARIDDAIALLKLPETERPHLIAMADSEIERAGRKYGPDAPETGAAVRRMDAQIGRLKAALDRTGLPIDLVVVSDHGMAKVEGGWITLNKFADLKGIEVTGQLLYGDTEADRVHAYNQLKHATSEFKVYRRKSVDRGLNYGGNPREGDPIVVATGPYATRVRGPQAGRQDVPPQAGADGYDVRVVAEMKAIFFAAGPDIVREKAVAPFENVNLYPWMAHMLGLIAPKSDGNLNILAGTLQDDGGPAPEPAQAKEAGQSKE